MTFKLAISPSQLDVITFSKQFQILVTVKNPSHGSGWDRCDLHTFVKLDDVSNLNQVFS